MNYHQTKLYQKIVLYNSVYPPNCSIKETTDLVIAFNNNITELLTNIEKFSYYINSINYKNVFIFNNFDLYYSNIYYLLSEDNAIIHTNKNDVWKSIQLFCKDKSILNVMKNIYIYMLSNFDKYKQKIQRLTKWINIHSIFKCLGDSYKLLNSYQINIIFNRLSIKNLKKLFKYLDDKINIDHNYIISLIKILTICNLGQHQIVEKCLENITPEILIMLSKIKDFSTILNSFVNSQPFKERWVKIHNYNWTKITHQLFNKCDNPVTIFWEYLIS